MNPPDGWGILLSDEIQYFCQHQILEKKSFSPNMIPKIKRLEERLDLLVPY